jgi:hypothetical protein
MSGARVRASVRALVKRTALWSARRPALRRAAIAVLSRAPALERRARALVSAPSHAGESVSARVAGPRKIEGPEPAILSRAPSAAEQEVETSFRRAFARAR